MMNPFQTQAEISAAYLRMAGFALTNQIKIMQLVTATMMAAPSPAPHNCAIASTMTATMHFGLQSQGTRQTTTQTLLQSATAIAMTLTLRGIPRRSRSVMLWMMIAMNSSTKTNSAKTPTPMASVTSAITVEMSSTPAS